MKLKVRHTREFIAVKWYVQNRRNFHHMLCGHVDSALVCALEAQMGMGWNASDENLRIIHNLLVELQVRTQNELWTR